MKSTDGGGADLDPVEVDHTESPVPDGALLDLAAIAALTVICLHPLTATFAGDAWWAVAASAACVGILVPVALLRWGWSGWLSPLILLLVHVLVAGPLVTSVGGDVQLFPDRGSIANALRASFSVWGELLGTLPLVDSTGTMLLIPLLLGLFPVGIAATVALHTRRPGFPALPMLALLLLVLLLGPSGLDGHLAHATGFAVVVVGWIGLRGARHGGHVMRSGRALTGVRVSLVLLVGLGAALLVPPAMDGDERLVLRETVSTGLDTTGIGTPLSGFRRYTRQPAGYVDNVYADTLLTVKGGLPGMRLRFAVLDWYDGSEWRMNPDVSPSDSRNRYLRVGSTLVNPSVGPLVNVHVKVHEAWRGNWVPTVGDLQSFTFSWSGGHDRHAELYYNPDTSAALLSSRLDEGDDYDFTSRLPEDVLTRNLEPMVDAVDEEVYLHAAFLSGLAQGWLEAGTSRMDSLFKAARALKRRGRYSDGAFGWEQAFLPGHDRRRLDKLFLRAPQMVGNDEQYAAVMALLANRMRIPARVVVGAKVPESGVVRGKDVEAWVEVQVRDGSWRTLDTRRFMGDRPPDRDPDLDRSPAAGVLKPPPPRTKSAEELRQERAIAEKMREEKRARDLAAELESDRTWMWWVLLLCLAAAPALARSVRRQHRRTTGPPARRIAAGWEELIDRADDLGMSHGMAAARPDQARMLGVDRRLAARADRSTFSTGRPGESDVTAFWDEVREAAQALGERAGAWRRLVAFFSVGTFLRRAGAKVLSLGGGERRDVDRGPGRELTPGP